MSTARFSLDASADIVLAGIKAALFEAIKARIDAEVQSIVKQAAREAAENLATRVSSWDNIARNSVDLHVSFNQKVLPANEGAAK